jgi:PhnB protein
MHREDQFIPELIVRNGPAALDFYKSVFGAEEVHRMMKPGSEKLMHGELTLDGHKFFVCDEFPASEGGTCKSPETLGGTGVRITVLVEDADGVVERAVAAGARVSMPVQDMFWGGRYGKICRSFRPRVGDQPTDQRTESRRDSGRGRRILREAKITRMSLV